MYDAGSSIFWYKFIFLIELIICESIFSYHLQKREKFPLLLPLAILASFLLVYAIPILSYHWAYLSFMFLFIFAITFAFMNLLHNESKLILLFCAISGYATQHIAFQIYNFINYSLSSDSGNTFNIYGDSMARDPSTIIILYLIQGLVFTFTAFVVWLLFARKLKNEIRIHHPIFVFLVFVLILVSVILNSIITYYSSKEYSKMNLLIYSVLSIVIVLLSLIILFMDTRQFDLEKQLSMANQIIHDEEKQFKQSKENMELMNIKCHDLKHQIRKLAMNKISSEELKEITDVINIYDSKIKSGNPVLDTVLSEKSLICNYNHITLTCLIDGEKLRFMSDADIYSLFGNAFDNAIEASLPLEEDRRVISLTSNLKGNIFALTLKNYAKIAIKWKDGLPLTSKGDKNRHGFGTLSIKRISEKYNGHLIFFYSNGVFTLSLWFNLDELEPF